MSEAIHPNWAERVFEAVKRKNRRKLNKKNRQYDIGYLRGWHGRDRLEKRTSEWNRGWLAGNRRYEKINRRTTQGSRAH